MSYALREVSTVAATALTYLLVDYLDEQGEPEYTEEHELVPEFEARVSRTSSLPVDFVIEAAMSAMKAEPFRAIPRVRADVGFVPRVQAGARISVHVDSIRRLHSIRQERILRDLLSEAIAR